MGIKSAAYKESDWQNARGAIKRAAARLVESAKARTSDQDQKLVDLAERVLGLLAKADAGSGKV